MPNRKDIGTRTKRNSDNERGSLKRMRQVYALAMTAKTWMMRVGALHSSPNKAPSAFRALIVDMLFSDISITSKKYDIPSNSHYHLQSLNICQHHSAHYVRRNARSHDTLSQLLHGYWLLDNTNISIAPSAMNGGDQAGAYYRQTT